MKSFFKIFNATELWQRENSLPPIPTFSQSLDEILGNKGLQLCTLTELLGLPGTGKTQLCLQLCASIQIPRILGGLSAEALYIDTNTNFTTCRFQEILSASLSRCQQLLDRTLDIKEENVFKKLHYVNAFGMEFFCAFMYRLPNFLAEKPNIKLIVIDSIAFPFKEGISAKQRTGLLFRQMAELQRLAVKKQIAELPLPHPPTERQLTFTILHDTTLSTQAFHELSLERTLVVLTNEMSTRVGLSGGSVVGALGDAWSHRCNARILLTTSGLRPDRLAVLLKGNDATSTVAAFQITHEGIRDID